MGPIARLLLFLLKLCPSVSVQVQQQEPSQAPDENVNAYLDTLDDYGVENWVDFIEYCYQLDPTKHRHDYTS